MSSADDARILAISAPVLLPIIRKRQAGALSRLTGAYHAGEADLRHYVAEYVSHTELLKDIEQKLIAHNKGES